LRSGRSRRLGIGGTDGRKIEMPTFYRSREAALARPMLAQSEQVWVGLSLTTGIYGQAQRRRPTPGRCGRRATRGRHRILTRMRTRLGAAMLLAAAFGGCAETIGDPYVAPGKFRFLRCPDIAARQDTAEARHTELLALMKRSGAGVGGGAVNTFVYGPDLNNVEAELRALQQTAAEKNCPVNTTKAPGKPEPGMGPIH
jgi:hypothetical protein